MKSVEKLCVCGEYFIPKNTKDRVCGECRQISRVADGEIYQIERVRSEYNRRHKKNITYGKFVSLLAIIKSKKRHKG